MRWSARICPRSNGDYTFEGRPATRELTTPYALTSMELDFGEADMSGDGKRVEYNPRLRVCPVEKIVHVCFTAAKLKIIATLTGNRIRFDRVAETTREWHHVLATDFGWRDQEDRD